MADLLIECENHELIDGLSVANAVYKVLKQRVNLYAEICFCGEEEIKKLNAETRNIDRVTDVLSFPAAGVTCGEVIKKKNYPFDVDPETGRVCLGSIMICIPRAKEQAAEYGHSEKREFSYLAVHGLLHLFGYDHETEEDKAEMREKEEEILALIGEARD